MNEQVFIVVRGRVQGVFFRAETRQKALQLGLTGWVKNTDDGVVEILAAGEGAKLKEFLVWCKKGPDAARVDAIDVLWQTPAENFSDFTIRY